MALTLVTVARAPRGTTVPPGTGRPIVRGGTADSTARVVLYRAARDVTGMPWHRLAPGAWLYFHYALSDPGNHGRAFAKPDFVEDEWLSRDGGARVVQYSNRVVLLVGSAREQLRSEKARQRRTTRFHVATANPPWPPLATYEQIVSMPSDIHALRSWIDRHAVAVGGRGERGKLAFIQQLVIDPRVRPAVAGSLYRLIASLPLVALIGTVRDPLGRRGAVVGFTVSEGTPKLRSSSTARPAGCLPYAAKFARSATRPASTRDRYQLVGAQRSGCGPLGPPCALRQ